MILSYTLPHDPRYRFGVPAPPLKELWNLVYGMDHFRQRVICRAVAQAAGKPAIPKAFHSQVEQVEGLYGEQTITVSQLIFSLGF